MCPNNSASPLDPPNPYARPRVPEGVHYAIMSVADALTGSTEHARTNAEKALQLLKSPSNETEFYARGQAYDVLGNYDEAIADFNKALQLDPKWASCYASRGNAYSAKNDYDRAIADFDRALQLEPDQKRTYIDQGRVFSVKNDWDNAIADYDMPFK